MDKPIQHFIETDISDLTKFRSIILFGRNVACYKFSLAKVLLDIATKQHTTLHLEDIALPYALNICEHVKHSPRQCVSSSSTFISACSDFNDGKINETQLQGIALRYGFVNVLDAFHVVNQTELNTKFFEYNPQTKSLIIPDEMFRLVETSGFGSLLSETEARWNLVETAWKYRYARSILELKYDPMSETFFTEQSSLRRKSITSAIPALNGYQKGCCFYCGDSMIDFKNDIVCDVDHFFPHRLQQFTNVNLDGAWNLVLACPNCNRGQNGKFALIPELKFLEKLFQRNEYLISSHHPLRESLIQQTGKTTSDRINFLQSMDSLAVQYSIHRWSPCHF